MPLMKVQKSIKVGVLLTTAALWASSSLFASSGSTQLVQTQASGSVSNGTTGTSIKRSGNGTDVYSSAVIVSGSNGTQLFDVNASQPIKGANDLTFNDTPTNTNDRVVSASSAAYSPIALNVSTCQQYMFPGSLYAVVGVTGVDCSNGGGAGGFCYTTTYTSTTPIAPGNVPSIPSADTSWSSVLNGSSATFMGSATVFCARARLTSASGNTPVDSWYHKAIIGGSTLVLDAFRNNDTTDPVGCCYMTTDNTYHKATFTPSR